MEGGVRSGEERGAEKHMDEYLRSIGLVRKRIAKDGSCLFRAVAEQVLHCQNLHVEIRARCVDFLRQNRDDYEAFIEGDFEDYLFKLRDPQQWVGEVEIHALSVMYKRDFLIFQEPGKPAVSITDNDFKDKVRLCFLNGNHYDSVYPDGHVRNAALCQSVLYELLYDGVFNVDRSLLKLCHRTGHTPGVPSDDSMAACRSSDDSDGGADEPLWLENETSSTAAKPNPQSHRGRGRGRQLPERVRRSLNPTLLRNIEYDVWQKSKRAQQKMDYSIAAGMHFTAGDRCQVRLESNGRSYSATVREVPPKNGPVSVYIEDLGVKQVPLWSLQPMREDGGWSTVVSRDRKLSNGHGDWDDRGRGKGRGKSTSTSNLQTSTTAVSGGRVQKQQSWPAGDEQGRSSRKPLSSVDVAFGLTVEQRQAREEEERNVALVEIRLRDELSFPALGKRVTTSNEGGKRKGEKKNSTQRNKTKSPVEDEKPPSPSTIERPKSSAPPTPGETTSPGATATTPSATRVTVSIPEANPPAVKAPAPVAPARFPGSELSFLGDSILNVTTVTDSTPKTTTLFASVASPPLPAPLPPAGRSTDAVFSFVTPALPPASALPPSPPKFIAPIAPSPTSFPPRPSPSPPPITGHEAQLAIAGTPSKLLPKAGSSLVQNLIKISAPKAGTQLQNTPVLQYQDTMTQSSEPPIQSQETTVQNYSLQNQETMSSSPQVQNQSMQQQKTASSSLQVQNQSLQHQENMSSSPQVQNQCLQNQETVQPTTQIQNLNLQNQGPMPSKPQVQSPALPIQNPETIIHNLQHQETVSSRPQIQSSPVQDQHPMPSGAQFQILGPDMLLQYQDQMVSAGPAQLINSGLQNPETLTSLAKIETPAHQELDMEPSTIQVQSQGPTPGPQSQDTVQTKAPVLGPTVPQQLSQVYQDLLYPGFPHGEKGDIAPTLHFSSNKSGDDLPRDVNILRFFYNLGVKAYSMPMCFPYLYILPLMQAHFLQPQPPSPPRSPSPQCTPANDPPRTQDPQPPPYSAPGYPPLATPPQQLPWQPLPPPRNPTYPTRYPPPVYPVPPSSQGYHLGQVPGQPVYHPVIPQYPHPSLGYQSQHLSGDLQARQGAMEPCLPPCGHPIPGLVPGPGLLEVPPGGANVANDKTTRASTTVPGFGGREAGETRTRPVVLMDGPLNNRHILVSDADQKNLPVSSRNPGSPSPYRGQSPSVYLHQGVPLHSVGCGTEDSWEEATGRGSRGRGHRGGRGRGQRRRYPGDMGAGLNSTQFAPSQRGRGHDRGY